MCDERRQRRGYANWSQGLAAEDSVARDYLARGVRQLARRWRGRSGEIDLVLQDGPTIVFVEVKRAASFEEAALRLEERQIGRILGAAEEYLDAEPGGGLTDCRFDLALVDARGRAKVIENAIAA